MSYKRKSKYNKPKEEVVEKLKLHLKKINELRTNNREKGTL
jgi:hypothetical protein